MEAFFKQYQSSTTPKIYWEPIPTKILATNFTVPAKFGKNDLHSSISTAVVQKGEVLLAKSYCSLAKHEKWEARHNMFSQSGIVSNTNQIEISSALSGCQPSQHLDCLHSYKSTAFALFQPNFGWLLSILSPLTKHTIVIAQIVIYQPSFQVVTINLTLTSTGC